MIRCIEAVTWRHRLNRASAISTYRVLAKPNAVTPSFIGIPPGERIEAVT